MSSSVKDHILGSKAIAIVRGIPSEKMEPLGKALLAGGISCMEVTFDHRSAAGMADTLRAIEVLCELFADRILVGAGTVLSAEEVQDAASAGAKYIISPNSDEKVIRETKRLGLVSLPGALTPTEIASAYDWGADIVKLFPAARLGPAYVKDIRGPLPHIPLAAVGGISPDNMEAFLKAGISCFGFGGNLVNVKAIAEGDFAAITATAKQINSILCGS